MTDFEKQAEENYTKVYLKGDMSLDTEEKYFAYTKGYCKGHTDGLAEGRKEHLEKIKENSIKFNAMTKSEKKNELCRKISNAINLDIHSNVCYMLNFCDMPQEMATELSEHYNAINEIIYEWKNKE